MPLPNTLNKWMKPSVGKFSNPSALNNPQPTTSISMANSSSSAKASVFDEPVESTGLSRPDSKTDQEIMDSRRYGYMRKLIRERQRREKQNRTKYNKIT